MAMIFQDPMTSLNPVFTIGDQISEAVLTHNPDMKETQLAHARSRCSRASESRLPSAASISSRTSSREECVSAR